MIKKRIPALILVAALALTALCSCGRDVDPVPTSTTTTAAEVTTLAAATTEEATTEAAWTPTADDYSRYFDDRGYLKGVKALDYIELPDFSGFTVDKADLETSDEDIDDVIASFIKNYITGKDEEKVIEDGDSVCISYTGYVDGKAFSGGSTGTDGTVVTIGVTNYIDDFLEQLIGHKPGDEISIEVTFPDDYGKDELNGKDAVFETKVLYVVTIPEFTQELMDEYIDYFQYFFNCEATTVEELKKSIYDTFYAYYLSEKVTAYIDELLKDIKYPQEAFDAALNNTKIYLATNYSYGPEEYMEEYSLTEDEFNALVEEDAKVLILYQAIAEQEKWEITEDEVKEYVGDNYDNVLASTGYPYLVQYLLYTKANNFIQDNVTVK